MAEGIEVQTSHQYVQTVSGMGNYSLQYTWRFRLNAHTCHGIMCLCGEENKDSSASYHDSDEADGQL